MFFIFDILFWLFKKNISNSLLANPSLINEYKEYCKNNNIKIDLSFETPESQQSVFNYSLSKKNTLKTKSSSNNNSEIDNVENYLGEGWSKKSSIEVKDFNNNKKNPSNINGTDGPFSKGLLEHAREQCSIFDYGGCGAIALINQINYLYEGLDYRAITRYPFMKPTQDLFFYNKMYNERLEIAKEVYKNLTVFRLSDGDIGTLPYSFTKTFNYILKKYKLNNFINVDCTAFGDLRYQHKLDKIDSLLNKGIPAIVWTTNNGGHMENHYFSIYAKEVWIKNNEQKTMYKVLDNFGTLKDLFIDIDSLKSHSWWGVIMVTELYNHLTINPDDFMFNQSYSNNNKKSFITLNNNEIEVYRTRCGYVNYKGFTDPVEFDWHLSISSLKKFNNGAECKYGYLELSIPFNVKRACIELTKWSSYEQFNDNAILSVEQRGSHGIFSNDIVIKDIGADRHNYKMFVFDKVDEFKLLKIIVQSNGFQTNKNRGRVLVGHIDLFC